MQRITDFAIGYDDASLVRVGTSHMRMLAAAATPIRISLVCPPEYATVSGLPVSCTSKIPEIVPAYGRASGKRPYVIPARLANGLLGAARSAARVSRVKFHLGAG